MNELLLIICVLLSALLLSAIVVYVVTVQKKYDAAQVTTSSRLADAANATVRARAMEVVAHLAEELPLADSIEDLSSGVKGLTLTSNIEALLRKEEAESLDWSIIQNILKQHHTQVLNQSKIQFWFSLGAATTGFCVVIAVVFISINDLSQLVLAIPGIFMEFIAGLFIRQAQLAQQRAAEFYDRLSSQNNVVQTSAQIERLVDQTKREEARARLIDTMITNLQGRQEDQERP